MSPCNKSKGLKKLMIGKKIEHVFFEAFLSVNKLKVKGHLTILPCEIM